jgi:PAS domain-containing protein
MLERRRSRLPRNRPKATPQEISVLGILERFPVPAVAVADDGAVLFANTAFAGALGCSRDAVMSMRYDDIVNVLPPEEILVAVARFHADTIVELRHLAGTTLYAKIGKSVRMGGDDAVVLATFAELTELSGLHAPRRTPSTSRVVPFDSYRTGVAS